MYTFISFFVILSLLQFYTLFLNSVWTNVGPTNNTLPAKHSTPKATKNNSQFDPIFHSVSAFDSALHNFQSAAKDFIQSKAEESCNEVSLIGALLELKLNTMSPKTARRKGEKIIDIFKTAASSDSE